MSLLGLLELYLRCWGVPPHSTGGKAAGSAHYVPTPRRTSPFRRPSAQMFPVGSRKPEHPQVFTLIKPELERRRRGGGEASREVPLLREVTWRASVASVATCAQLPETVPSVVYPAATATVLSLSGPWVCPHPFSVDPAAASQGLAGVASHSCWGQGPLCVRATTGRVLRCERVLGASCCSRRRSPPLAPAGSPEAARVTECTDEPS